MLNMTKTKQPLKIEVIPQILNAILTEEDYIRSCDKRIIDIISKIESTHVQIKSLQESHENNMKSMDLHVNKLKELREMLQD